MTSEPVPCGGIDPADVWLREARRAEGAVRVALLRLVAARTAAWRTDLVEEERRRGELFPVALRYTAEQIESLVVDEVASFLGLSRGSALSLVGDARVLTVVMPDVLTALEEGRLDLDRVTALVRATQDLPDPAVARVAETVLAGDRRRALGVDDPGVWDLVSCSAWRGRVARAVARAAARGRTTHLGRPDDQRPHPRRGARRPDVLRDRGGRDAAAPDPAGPRRESGASGAVGPDGRPLRAGEREAAALVGLCVTGERPAGGSGEGRRREVGIVLHADTFFDDGPAVDDPGQLRGAGTPIAVPAPDVRTMAATALDRGAGTSLVLADDSGRLVRLARVGTAPVGGWTRSTLVSAGRVALAKVQSLRTTGHDPLVAIDEHVRAAHPTSTGPGTGCATHSGSRRIDLDHVVPHPRGPTTPTNLQPLHRTPHRHKTRGHWHCHLNPDGTTTWTTRTGATWTYSPEPLPGYAPGEAYSTLR